jgi:transposase InsO family protein
VAALIAAQREQHRIPQAVSCRALGVSQSWFYKWRNGRPSPRAQRREALRAEVARLFALHRGKYGSPRITADLRDARWRVSENTVAAVMREQGLAARRKNRRKGNTRPGKGRQHARALRTWSGVISQPSASTVNGSAMGPRFPLPRASCTWSR